MSKLFFLEPEVAGELGEQSQIEYKNGIIETINFLNYEFFGWLGDELLTSTPCFIVTESLAKDIVNNGLTGCSLENALITKSDEFIEMYPRKKLPTFKRLLISGTVTIEGNKATSWSGHDFCLLDGIDLIVSERALNVIGKRRIRNCDITDIDLS